MRNRPDGVCSPLPLIDTMPSVYRGDPLAQQLGAAFDDVLAPIFGTLDCLPAYLDPKTAPEDMLDWLAGWIGLTIGGHETATRKRELITAGASILPWRGTVRSVHEAVVAAFNRETEVIEAGAATCSTEPDSEPGGQPVPTLVVRVFTDDADDIDRRSLDAVVEAAKPAHIPHRVEVITRPAQPSGDGTHAPVTGPPQPSGDGADTSRDLTEPPGDGADRSREAGQIPAVTQPSGEGDLSEETAKFPKLADRAGDPPPGGAHPSGDGEQGSGG